MTVDKATKGAVADSVSFRLVRSKAFRIALLMLPMAALLMAPVIAAFILYEAQDLPGSQNLWTILGFVVGAVATISYAGLVLSWMRRVREAAVREIDAWASSLGLTARAETVLTGSLRARPFSLGGTHVVLAGWHGRHRGQDVELFHYKVSTGTREHPEVYEFTVAAAAGAPTPHYVEALPQRGFHAMLAGAGSQDVDTGNPEFDAAWRVRADDERTALTVITPSVAQRLLEAKDAGVRVAWDGEAVAVVDESVVARCGDLEVRLDLVADLAALANGSRRRGSSDAAAPVNPGTGAPAAGLAAAGAAMAGAASATSAVPAPSPSGVAPAGEGTALASAGREPAPPAPHVPPAPLGANPEPRRQVEHRGRSNTELVTLLVGLVALVAGGFLWGRANLPVLGIPLVVLGFVIAFGTNRVVGAIERKRRRVSGS